MIRIRRTLSSARGGVPTFNDLKTAAGARTPNLPPTPVVAVRVQRDRQNFDRQRFGEAYADYDLVFATQFGTPSLASNVVRRFKAALKHAGLPGTYRPHDLRHANA